MRGTKYLSEIMKEIELSKDKNNLLISPIGCGKTHYAINILSQDKRVIYLCEELELKPICIWSINNQRKLNDEQNKVREHLLKEYELLDPYNVLIINKSSETGINIHDEDMKLCLVNSTNPTEITQSRGRIRHDVDLLVVRTNQKELPKRKITVDDKYLNEYISKDEMYKLIAKYDIKNKDGKLIGLRAFIDTLRNSNYKVNSKRKKIKNVLYTYYMITE